MAHVRVVVSALGGLLLILFCGVHAQEGRAQDRSVPRFGPVLSSDTVAAAPADLGRIWSFADPPLAELRRAYGPVISGESLRGLRAGVVRLPGCSGTLVSPRGLVLTAARCLDGGSVHEGTDAGADSAFVSEQAGEDRPLDGLYVDRLLGVDEVTAQVEAARRAASSDGDSARWAAAAARVEKTRQDARPPGRRVQVVREGGGRQYVAYTYQRHEDVRLVFRPHRAVTALGQADGMLSYPQHAWDVAALRVYEEGAPLSTPEYVEVHEQGTRPGDPVVAAGHPSTLPRAESAAQHAFRRDVTLPVQRAALHAAITHLRTYLDTAATAERRWRDRLGTWQDQQKHVRARRDALQSDDVMARLQARDAQLRAADRPGVLDTLAALQADKRTYGDRYRAASFLFRSLPQSATLSRALIVHRARTDGRPPTAAALEAVSDQPPAVDAALLRRQLRGLQENGLEIDAEAASRVVEQSVFATADSVRTLRAEDALPADDPALSLAVTIREHYTAFTAAWTGLQERERRLTERLAQHRLERDERPVVLPRARAPRFSDGRIKAYPYNGTVAPPFTTLYGLYGRAAGQRTATGRGLPSPWQSPSSALDRSTPLVTVSSTDLPGTHGGPLLNSDLQLVGIQFDTNLQGGAGAYLFVPDRMRTVSVDIRGVLEGLTHVYGAERLVRELTSPPSASK